MWENQDIQTLVSVHAFLEKAGFQRASAALYKECVEMNIGCLPPKDFPESELDSILSNVLCRRKKTSITYTSVNFFLIRWCGFYVC